MSFQDRQIEKEFGINTDSISLNVIMLKEFEISNFKKLNNIPKTEAKSSKIVILNFWATWCNPCIKELPEFQKLYLKFKNKNVQFIFASNEKKERLNKFFLKNENRLKLPFYTYSIDEIDKNLDHSILPTTYIINTETKIAFKIQSVQNWNSIFLTSLINTLSKNE